MLDEIKADLRTHADEAHAAISQRFFKTGPGEHGEGDKFIGVRVPAIRRVAAKYRKLPLDEVGTLMQSDPKGSRVDAQGNR